MPAKIKLVPTKMPVFEGIKFSDNDRKFHSWLTTFWPKEAQNLKAIEKDGKAYQAKFKSDMSQYHRLWKGYMRNAVYGQLLVEEVRQRLKRIAILDKYIGANTKDQQAKLYGDLTNIVSKEFDISVTIKKFDYNQLQRRINRMTEVVSKREGNLKNLVQRRDAEIKKRIVDLVNSENEGGSSISEAAITVKPHKSDGNNTPVVIKLRSTKMPVFEGVKFSDDDRKFHSWLTTFWPDEAHDLKDLEKKAKEYQTKLNHFKDRFARHWKTYKHSAIYGQYLVEEVKLRHKKLAVLDKYADAKTKEQKANFLVALTDATSNEFDFFVTSKKSRYGYLRERIDNMRTELAGREKEVKALVDHKDEVLRKRVAELIKQEKDNRKKEAEKK